MPGSLPNFDAQPAPAPLPGDDGVMCARLLFACTGHPHALIPWPHRLLHDAVAHISDLTRRLAEEEARLEFYQGLAKERHDREVACIARAEAAEARATTAEQEACEALAGAHAEQEVSRHWKEEAEYQKARVRELEAENGRFAGMLEDSVSGWRKLYTEERAERVRIEGILLNDVQAERQESDEHIKGLNAVIKTQDKAIRDLKSRVAEAEAERDALRERCEKLLALRQRTEASA